MLYQLHHQNKEDRSKTEMMVQLSTEKGNMKKIGEELKIAHEEFPPPDGWEWLIVPEGAKEFLYTTEEEMTRLRKEAKNNVNAP